MMPCSLTDEWTVSMHRKKTEGYQQRQTFEVIMSLMDKKAVSLAAERFEQKMWTFMRLVLQFNRIVDEKLAKYDRYIQSLQNESGQIPFSGNNAFAPFAAPPKWDIINMLKPEATPLQKNIVEATHKKDELFKATLSMFTELSLPNSREKLLKRIKQELPNELYEELLHFSVDDPYEICFAILYLLDSGSNIPWLRYGALSVTYTALDQLPFAYQKFNLSEIPLSFSKKETRTLYDYRYPCYGKHEDENDCDDEPINRSIGCNLSHFLYGYTGMVWPHYNDCAPLPTELRDALQQMEKDGYDVYSLLLSPICTESKHDEEFSIAEMLGMDKPEKDEKIEENEQVIEQENSSDSYKKLEEEIRALNTQRHQANLTIKDLKKEKSRIEAEKERLRQELAELRESIYRFQNDKEPSDKQEQIEIKFPFSSEGKIVSFGGHITWLNKIRSLLPSVRFIAPNQQPDEKVIRNADAVWLQPNCMSHSDFFKIIRVASNAEKPVHYFSFASAEQCARQLVTIEMNDI